MADAVAGAEAIVEGRCDALPEGELFMVGALPEVTP